MESDDSQQIGPTADISGNHGSPSEEATRYLAAHHACRWLVSAAGVIDPPDDHSDDEGDVIHNVVLSPRTRPTLRGLTNGRHTSTSDHSHDEGEEINNVVLSPRTRQTLRGMTNGGHTSTGRDGRWNERPPVSAMSSAQSLRLSPV